MSFVFIKNIKKLFGTGVVLGIIAGVLLCGSTIAYAQVGGLSDVGANSGLSTQPLGVTIGKIVSAILGFLGIVSFIIIFYAGFLWMTARGNEDQVERAKAVMRNGLIGLIIILTSYSLTQFVLSRLLSATNNVPPHCFNGTLDGDETAVDCGGSWRLARSVYFLIFSGTISFLSRVKATRGRCTSRSGLILRAPRAPGNFFNWPSSLVKDSLLLDPCITSCRRIKAAS
jgi:hypothetical protein